MGNINKNFNLYKFQLRAKLLAQSQSPCIQQNSRKSFNTGTPTNKPVKKQSLITFNMINNNQQSILESINNLKSIQSIQHNGEQSKRKRSLSVQHNSSEKSISLANIKKSIDYDQQPETDKDKIRTGFERVFDKIQMDNNTIKKKFERSFSQMNTLQEKIDFMNWVLNQNYSESVNKKTIGFAFRPEEFFTFLWAGDGSDTDNTVNEEKTIEQSSSNKVKVIVRNSHGRFGWCFKVFCMVGHERFQRDTQERALYNKEYLIAQISHSNQEQIAILKKTPLYNQTGQFQLFLQKVQSLLKDRLLDQYESQYQSSLDTNLVQQKASLYDHSNIQNIASRKQYEDSSHYTYEYFQSKLNQLDKVRFCLVQFNFLIQSNMKQVKQLDCTSQEFHNFKSHLDIIHSRESVKIAVLFVDVLQIHQQKILQNKRGSSAYQLFLQQLGVPVSLKTHLGYLGGLSDHQDGSHTLYHANQLMEMSFHISTMMPTNPNDQQNINKKRHIGNNHVSLVWSDSLKSYRRNTIRSQFNCVVIVIQPHHNSLYKISILKKPSVQMFFPAYDQVLLSFEQLPVFVRLIGIQAFRASKIQQVMSEYRNNKNVDIYSWNYQNYMFRNNQIKEIIKNYQCKTSQQVDLVQSLIEPEMTRQKQSSAKQ